MTTPSAPNTVDPPDGSGLTIRSSDDQQAAHTVLNQTIIRAAALVADLRVLADQYRDTAPASSANLTILTGAIANTVLDGIERWPS